MARCLTCGRRFLGETPPCGHDKPPLEGEPAGEDAFPVPDIEVTGYRIGEVLGRGGFGTVLAATRESDQRKVAVKLIHRSNRDARKRLVLEARALATIGSPHVPELYEDGTHTDESPYIVFEYLSMSSLDRKLVEWGKPLEPAVFVALADAILAALEATHRSGFIHRDLKPENIFIAESPAQAKLIDFGIAKAAGASTTETIAGLALGTPEYMAPEQCEARPNIDARADIYAIGVVLYEMLTGRPPFFGSAAEVRQAHVGHRPLRPSRVAQVSPAFDSVLLRCLAKDPARRFDSVGALRKAISHAVESGRSEPSSSGNRQSSKRDSKRSQKQRMGMVFFDASVATGRVKKALLSLGGQLASVEGKRCVAIFGLESGGNPVMRAHKSAQALVGQGLCERALVDHEQVRVRKRPDGSQRVFSPVFSKSERFPREDDPPGALLTSAAVEALPELRTVEVRDGVLRELSSEGDTHTDATVLQLSAVELLGREEPFQALMDSALAAMDERRPGITTVVSEVGHGKSHLSAAVFGEIRRTRPMAQLFQLRAREPIGGESNETLVALLRATLELPRTPPEEFGRALLTARLGAEIGEQVWPAVALVMGWLDAEAPQVRKLSAAPAALRSAATRAAGEALRKRAEKGPVCCLLDDAHFADTTTLDALEYATLAGTELPLWVCVLATPNFESARPSWGRRAGHADRIELGPLGEDSAAELCRLLLRPAENVSKETVERLVAQTRGSPLLLVELVRGIKRHGLIRQRGRGDAWFLANDELADLPDLPKVEWLAERELAVLPPELAAHARLLAQLSGDFVGSEVEGVLGELEAAGLGDSFPLDAAFGVKRLLSQGLLVTHRDGSHGFRHQLIRDYVAQATPAELRKQIHLAAVRYYEAAEGMQEPRRLPRLAQHAADAGLAEQASALYLELAERAAYRHSYVDAELMYSRALSLLSDEEHTRRMRALNGRGLMRYRLSRFEDSLTDLDAALALARKLEDTRAEVEILLDEATVLDWMRDFRRSQTMVVQAGALAEEARTELIDARLCLGEARARFRMQEWEDAISLAEKAAEQARGLGDPGYETRVIALLLLGVMQSLLNRIDGAKATFEQLIPLCEVRGDRVHLATAYNNRFAMWFFLRDVENAARDGLRCRQIGREIGLSELEYMSSYNLAEVYYCAGDVESARPHLRRAAEIEPSNSQKPNSLLLEARIGSFTGELDAVRRVLKQIEAILGRAADADEVEALLVDSEQVFFEMAELFVRQAPDEEWRALLARACEISPPHELAELVEIWGLVASRRGDRGLAIEQLEQALEICSRTSHLIEDRIRRELESLRNSSH